MERTAGIASAAVRRAGSTVVALAVVAVVLIRLAWDAGGYFPPAYLSAAAIASAAAAVLVVVAKPGWRFSTHALVGLGSLAALAAWTGLSSRWSPTPAAAVQEMQRDVLYLALFGLGLLAAGSGRYARLVPWAVAGIGMVIVVAGLLSRLEPDLVSGAVDSTALADGRLGYPFGYWNAYGALAAMTTVLTCGLSGDPRTPTPARAVAAGASLLAFVGMYMSLSRGAWLAIAVGLVVLLAAGVRRASLALTIALIGAAAAIAIGRLQSYPELIGSGAGSPHESAGHAFAGQLAVIVGIVVAVQWLIAAGRASPNLMQAARRVGRPIGIALAAVAALAAIVTYGLKSGPIEGHSANALHDASSFVSRQWGDFLRPTIVSEGGTARLVTAKGTRSDLYRVAIDGFEGDWLKGDGVGGFEVRWARERRVDESVRNAHSLELETMGQLGLVGILLLLGFLGSILVAVVRSRTRPGGLGRGQTAAVGAAVAVWIGHSGVDWDWQQPAVTGCALVLAAPLFPYGQFKRRRSSQRSGAADEAPELGWSRVGAWRRGSGGEIAG